MTLQTHILDLLDGVALRPYVLYQALHDAGHEATDAALKNLRRTGRVVLVEGRFQRPSATQIEKPLPKRKRQRRPPLGKALTSREVTVAIVAAEGGTAQAIAAALGMSCHTLKGHLSSIYAKWGISGKGEILERLRAQAA